MIPSRFKLVLLTAARKRLAKQPRVSTKNGSTKTHFEVERKFALTKNEYRTLPQTLIAKGFQFAGQVFMTDTFLPVITPGDMMRIRVQTKEDKTTAVLNRKTWVEIDGGRERKETPDERLSDLAKGCLLELGERLNGGPLPSFSKDRDHYKGATDGPFAGVVVVLDSAEGLGEYSGSYIEIEVLVPIGGDVQSARDRINSLVSLLLGEQRECVSLSYQDMLMRSKSAQSDDLV